MLKKTLQFLQSLTILSEKISTSYEKYPFLEPSFVHNAGADPAAGKGAQIVDQ